MRNLQVNGERLWASLMELALIGATPKGGVCRLAASDLDGEARRLGAKSRYFDALHQYHSKLRPHQLSFRKKLQQLIRPGIGRNVVILRFTP